MLKNTISQFEDGEYCVSKAGVSMMTTLYAARLAEFGIGVFEVRPGIIGGFGTAGPDEVSEDLTEPLAFCGMIEPGLSLSMCPAAFR